MLGLEPHALWIMAIFIVGYVMITIENYTHINKSTVALMMAVLCWVAQFVIAPIACEHNMHCLGDHIGNICQIIFFILGALSVVEIISSHKGFSVLSGQIKTKSKRKMLWIIGFMTFFLSAVLDNLTTTIVMVTLLKKLIDDPKDRMLIGGGVVIAANAGGAWTPIGDVTTTMLWIGGQLSALEILYSLFLPSLACLLGSFGILHFMFKGDFKDSELHTQHDDIEPLGKLIFYLGIALLIFVPVFKVLTGLPPFMGMLFALSTLWLVTDIAHAKYDNRHHLRVPYALTKIDISGTLFFLGILLAISALDTAQLLSGLAQWMDHAIGNVTVIATAIGVASAIVDNVPLVAASMGMYELTQYPMDASFWKLIAYCAGTGGSMLIIGSAAGVVYMGLERVDFLWYLRRISLPAAVGYFLGIAVYLLIGN